MKPGGTSIRGRPAPWDDHIRALWAQRVAPKFKDGETCSDANYFTPRPWRNEYDPGSETEGFSYIVQPGNRVCVKEWTP